MSIERKASNSEYPLYPNPHNEEELYVSSFFWSKNITKTEKKRESDQWKTINASIVLASYDVLSTLLGG